MAFGRGILSGVARYVRLNGPWTVYIEQRSLVDPAPPWLKSWDGDGVISRLPPRETRLLRAAGIHTVDLNDQGPGQCRPHIQSDHRAEGALGAEHLIERGFASFAFFGYPQFAWSRDCRTGFTATVRAAGHPCHQYRRTQRVSLGHQQPSWELGFSHVEYLSATFRQAFGLPPGSYRQGAPGTPVREGPVGTFAELPDCRRQDPPCWPVLKSTLIPR